MKRKATAVLIFCIALFGAIVAGYWDLLNSERTRIAAEGPPPSSLIEPSGPLDTFGARQEGQQAGPRTSATRPESSGEPRMPGAPEAETSLLSDNERQSAEAGADAAGSATSGQEAGASDGSPEASSTAEASGPPPSQVDAPGSIEESPAPPRFDILRVEADGSTVIAGTAPAGASVRVVDVGRSIGKDTANASGEFVVVLDAPLAPGDYQLRIEAQMPDGRRLVSGETAIVSVPEAGSENELLALVESPDAAARLIAVPSAASSPGAGMPGKVAEGAAAAPDSRPGGGLEDAAAAPRSALASGKASGVDGLSKRVAEFFSRAGRFADNLAGWEGGLSANSGILAEAAGAITDEGRALAEELPLAAGSTGTEAATRLTELVRQAAETAEEIGATTGAVDMIRTSDAAARLAALADEGNRRAGSLDIDAGPSGSDGVELPADTSARGAATSLAVEAVEIEADRIFIAGRAETGSTVRVYLDAQFLAEHRVAGNDRFLIEAKEEVTPGGHLIRADQVGADGTVHMRAEVPFFRPEGETMAAIAPADPRAAPIGGDGELLPRDKSGADANAIDGEETEVALAAPGRGTPDAVNGPQRPSAPGDATGDAADAAVTASGDGQASSGPGVAKTSVAAGSSPSEAADSNDADDATASGPATRPETDGTAGAQSGGTISGEPAHPARESGAAGENAPQATAAPLSEAIRSEIGAAPPSPSVGGQEDAAEGSLLAGSGGALRPPADAGVGQPLPDATAMAGSRPDAPGQGLEQAANPSFPVDAPEILVTRQAALEPADSRVIIRKGDTLWEISRDTYGRGSRYTIIYLANGDQIRDPDRIYPGQVFRLPESLLKAIAPSANQSRP